MWVGVWVRVGGYRYFCGCSCGWVDVDVGVGVVVGVCVGGC